MRVSLRIPLVLLAFAAVTATASAQTKTRIDAQNFSIEVEPGACAAKSECVVKLRLVAGPNFHVNDKFPYRFTGAEGAAWAKPVFSKDTGDLTIQNEQSATLNVAFTPDKSGKTTATGVFKLSVCSASSCQVEKQTVTIETVAK